MPVHEPDPSLRASRRDQIYGQTLRYFFAPVADLLFDDESVTEVMINGPREIYCEREGRVEFQPGRAFADEQALEAAVRNLAEFVGREVDERQPLLDARLPEPDRFRVNVVLAPISRQGVCVSIRKFARETWTLDRLVRAGMLTTAAREYLGLMVRTQRNVLVSGGAGAGKTTLLNALFEPIPDRERVIVIEDTAELRLTALPHVITLEARPPDADDQGAVTIRDLFVNSLRMRPDRIIVGEVRRGEALDLIQAMLSGHDGVLSTIHASTPLAALVRLETLCLMNDVAMPVYVARTQVASAIHVLVQVVRSHDGRRRVQEIVEVIGLDGGEKYQLRPIFRHKPSGHDGDGPARGRLEPTGLGSRFAREVRDSIYAEEVGETDAMFAESPLG